MKILTTILTVLVKAQILEGAVVCSDTFNLAVTEAYTIGSNCYYGFGTAMNFADAKTLCESGGAHILFAETPTETDTISGYFSGSFEQVWIGARKISGTWKWVEGATETPIVTTYFDSTPSSTNNCAKTSNMFIDYMWTGADELETNRAICEKLGATPTTAPLIAVNPGQKYYSRRYTPSNQRNQLSVTECRTVVECAVQCVGNANCISLMLNTTENTCKLFALASPAPLNDGCSASNEISCWDEISA